MWIAFWGERQQAGLHSPGLYPGLLDWLSISSPETNSLLPLHQHHLANMPRPLTTTLVLLLQQGWIRWLLEHHYRALHPPMMNLGVK